MLRQERHLEASGPGKLTAKSCGSISSSPIHLTADSEDPHPAADRKDVCCPDPVDCLVANANASVRDGKRRHIRVAVDGESSLEEPWTPEFAEWGDIHVSVQVIPHHLTRTFK